ncbi:hypothetical protein QLX67_06785 [Balneolaceae bacterium ANBcel3]|nr:hypothetical protein [Balneolaceae bacterium ANBcel3]
MKQKKQKSTDRPMSDYYFAEAIAKRAELYLVNTPDSYDIAYALVDRFSGNVTAWLEVVCQKGMAKTDLLFCLKTWMKGLELSSRTGKPFVIAFRKDDNDYLLEIHKEEIPLVLVDALCGTDVANNFEGNTPMREKKAYVRIPLRYFHSAHVY